VRLLPPGGVMALLADLMRTVVGPETGWDAQLVLRHDQVPAARLGSYTRLGWTGWLSGRSAQRDADDVVLAGTP